MEDHMDPALFNSKYAKSQVKIAQGIESVMPLLEQIFDPHGTRLCSFRDTVIISLDLEYDLRRGFIRQLGVSTLDTRQLAQVDTNDIRSICDAVSNQLYVLKHDTSKKHMYCYGDPISAKGLTLEELLLPILTPIDTSPTQKPSPARNIILIGHTINADLLMLERCGCSLKDVPNIKALIDIAEIGSRLNRSKDTLSLKRICQQLGIRTHGFHNAAHDALYTLQALLLLFHLYESDKEKVHLWSLPMPDCKQDQIDLWECQLEILQFIGKQLGTALWLGTPIRRKKAQIKREYEQRCVAQKMVE
ncbi:MAG: hypothetical protein Q9227_008443 [Pyrenula ochraceoflavens]